MGEEFSGILRRINDRIAYFFKNSCEYLKYLSFDDYLVLVFKEKCCKTKYTKIRYKIQKKYFLQALTAWSPWERRLCFLMPFMTRALLWFLRASSVGGGDPAAFLHVILQVIYINKKVPHHFHEKKSETILNFKLRNF